jgi:hypothetical protein
MTATGTAYSLEEARMRAESSLLDGLRSNVPPSKILDESTIAFGPSGTDPGAGLVTIRATAQARPVWSAEQERQVANAIAGRSLSEATDYLRALPGVEAVEIDSSPSFLPTNVPRHASRITIRQQ